MPSSGLPPAAPWLGPVYPVCPSPCERVTVGAMRQQAVFDAILMPKILDQKQAGDDEREGDCQPDKRARSPVIVVVGHLTPPAGHSQPVMLFRSPAWRVQPMSLKARSKSGSNLLEASVLARRRPRGKRIRAQAGKDNGTPGLPCRRIARHHRSRRRARSPERKEKGRMRPDRSGRPLSCEPRPALRLALCQLGAQDTVASVYQVGCSSELPRGAASI